jgi:hypothetical protein
MFGVLLISPKIFLLVWVLHHFKALSALLWLRFRFSEYPDREGEDQAVHPHPQQSKEGSQMIIAHHHTR